METAELNLSIVIAGILGIMVMIILILRLLGAWMLRINIIIRNQKKLIEILENSSIYNVNESESDPNPDFNPNLYPKTK